MKLGERKHSDPNKSYVSMLVCPWCSKETGELILDKRIRLIFEMRTPTNEPCKDCMPHAILLYDWKTEKFIGYAKKSQFLGDEALAKFAGTPIKALVEIEETAGGYNVRFHNEGEKAKQKKFEKP